MNKNERIAYIITVYKDPDHLKRLIDALNDNADFFIHVDAKVDQSLFQNKLEKYENVFFNLKRYFINWGGFGQVLSQMALLETVIQQRTDYNRVVCLSGLDYPLYSNQEIRNVFDNDPHKEFIQGLNITTTTNVHQQRKIKLYHFLRDIKISNVLVKKFFSGGARILLRILPFRKPLKVLIDNEEKDVYMGSDYWALTFPCASYVYSKMKTEKKLMRYFKTSFVPSEMCINTIVFNSPYAVHAVVYPKRKYEGVVSLTPLHYIEYKGAIKIFNIGDLPKLVHSNKMFFRKSTTGISDELLDTIDMVRSGSNLTAVV
jgi:hypothetical protein